MLAVDAGTDADHRCRVALQHGHVVQGAVHRAQRLVVGLHLNDGTALHDIVVDVKSPQTCLYVTGSDVSEEAEPPHVDTEDGDIASAHTVGCLQERAVATHRDGEVGLKVIPVKDLCRRNIEPLVVLEEIEILPVNGQHGTALTKTRQHFLYGCRLLCLIDIAEKGEL